ncbi:MAG: hypothetical protein E7453_01815 [Ruminococcaceae bacterium]|nr:hypothetical protein [Oscillospiraceae bacterium]
MKRLLSILLVLLILLGSTPSVSANSAQSYWEGVDRTGAIVTSGESPIVVEKELLTFDLQEFPQPHYWEEAEFLAYSGKVTAAYTFHNPSELTVSAKLLFPFGAIPWYGMDSGTDTGKYDILIDGQPVEKKIRHTLSYYGQFDLEQDLSLLSDTFAEDPFYSPALPVTVYKFSISGVDTATYKSAVVAFDVPEGLGARRYYLDDCRGSHQQNNGDMRIATSVRNNGSSIALYVFGEPLKVYPEFKFYQDGGAKDSERISGTARFSGIEETTFQAFALNGWNAETGVSEEDWYNAIVADLNTNVRSKHPIIYQIANQNRLAENLMRWYEYEITLQPGQRIVNSVTAPIYPSIDLDYDPDIYGYTYLLSPAKTWKSFGELEIVVNTPYYITESSLDGYEKTDTGYTLTLDGLPEGELTFTLSEAEDPEPPKVNIFYGFLYGIAFFFSMIGYLFQSLFDGIANLFQF